MKENEYFRLLKEAESRYQRDLESIKTVWRLANGGPPPMPKAHKVLSEISKAMPPSQASEVQVVAPAQKVNVRKIVEEIISKMDADSEFNIHDIAKSLRNNYPGVKFNMAYLSSVLMRIRETESIKVAKEREGTEAAKYKRA